MTRSVNLLLVDDEVKFYPADHGICGICKLAQIYVLLACTKMLAYSAKVVEFRFVVWSFVGRVIQRPILPMQVFPVRLFLFNWCVCHESSSLYSFFLYFSTTDNFFCTLKPKVLLPLSRARVCNFSNTRFLSRLALALSFLHSLHALAVKLNKLMKR